MNKITVLKLLEQWTNSINDGEKTSKNNAKKLPYGLLGKIKRATGQPVIFDLDTYEQQKKLQKAICQECPQFADLVLSQPEIMDGFHWTRRDFIELYFSHYRLVIEKLHRIIDRETTM